MPPDPPRGYTAFGGPLSEPLFVKSWIRPRMFADDHQLYLSDEDSEEVIDTLEKDGTITACKLV